MDHLILIIPLIYLILINKRISKLWLSPSNILCITWAGFLFLHLILTNNWKFSYISSLYIFLFILAFNLGGFTFISQKKNNSTNNNFNLNNPKQFKSYLHFTIIIGSFISMIGAILYFRNFISHFGSFSLFLESDVRASLAEISTPILIRLCMLLAYPMLILASIYYIITEKKSIFAYPALPIIFIGIVQAGRAGTLMIIVIIFFAIYWKSIYQSTSKKDYINAEHRVLRYFIILVFFGILIFTLGYWVRFRSINFQENNPLESFKSYLLGAISAFDSQLRNPEFKELAFGKFNFSSLFDLLGIAKNEVGVYTTYYSYTDDGISTTNIFTIFRPLMDDFGFIGTTIFMFIIGYLGNKHFYSGLRKNLKSIAFLILFYTYLFHSTLLPITVHTSIVLSFFIPEIIIYIYQKGIKF